MSIATCDSILLRSQRLTVEIAPPGTLYDGSRFDWTGFITQLTLDGQHTFCGVEPVPDRSVPHGAGLCGEFGLFGTIGYDDCSVGGRFVKPGVGLLPRPDLEPYRFSRPYDLEPFPTTVSSPSPSEVVMTQEPLPWRGYALRYSKRMAVSGPILAFTQTLENVGERPISITEYNHSFMTLADVPIGPAYHLVVPFEPTVEDGPPELSLTGREVTFSAPLGHAIYCRLQGFAAQRPAACVLQQRHHGLAIAFTTDFPLHLFPFWAAPRVVSPELFIQLDLAPGQHRTWHRTFTCHANPNGAHHHV